MNKRLIRERNTVDKMIALYCRDHHTTKSEQLCVDCQSLLDYAKQHIEHCPFGVQKPTCAKCPVHCYRSEKREEIRLVMRYAGPRMLFHQPFLAILHLFDGLRLPPEI